VRTGDLPSSADEAVDRIIDLVQGFVAVFTEQMQETSYYKRLA
jgi:hypothetical protein